MQDLVAFAFVLGALPYAASFALPPAASLEAQTLPLRGSLRKSIPQLAPLHRTPKEMQRLSRLASGSDGEGADASVEQAYSRAQLGMSVLVASEAIAVVAGQGAASAGSMSVHIGRLQALIVTVAALKVMKGAAARGRLSGGTFRMLALGLLAGFGVVTYHAVFQVIQVLVSAMTGAGISLSAVATLSLGYVAAAAGALTVAAAYRTLEEQTLPKFKLAVQAETMPLTALAVGYAVAAMHAVVWGGAVVLYSKLKLIGALRCFVVAACAHVCQTAAVAGPKRLSSETYQLLNLGLVVDGAVRLATVAFRGYSASLWLFPALSLVTAGAGLAVGKYYAASNAK